MGLGENYGIIMGIFLEYHGNIMGLSWEYCGIMELLWEYCGNIIGIIMGVLGDC